MSLDSSASTPPTDQEIRSLARAALADTALRVEPRALESAYCALDERLARAEHGDDTHEVGVRKSWRAWQNGLAPKPFFLRVSGFGRGTLPRRAVRRWVVAVSAAAVACLAALVLRSGSGSEPMAVYHTAVAQRSTVRLAEGSAVTLAPSTSLTVTPHGLELRGEAYFDVASRPSRPFVVRTGNAVVEVLGTRFVVRQYPEDRASRVVVEDGRVAVGVSRGAPGRAVVTPRMLALVSDSGVTVTTGVATREYTGWTRGTLVFDWVVLGDVLAELGRAYGAEIRVADTALAKRKLRMDVSIAETPLPQVLELIGEATDAHYARDGRAFVLSPGRAAERPARPSLRQHLIPQTESRYGK